MMVQPLTTFSAANEESGGLASSAPARGMKIVGIGAGIPLVFEALGGDFSALCAECGVDPETFSDPRNIIAVEVFARILHLGARRLNVPCFGLMVGARMEVAWLGVLGEAMRVCDTLGEALRLLDAHFQVNTRGLRLQFHEERDAGYLALGLYEPLQQGAAQSLDIAVAAAVQLVRKICDTNIAPLEVRLPRRRPPDIEPYRAILRCPVRFDAPEAVIAFRPESLVRRLPGANPALRAALERLMRQREAAEPLGFEEELRRTVRPGIIGGRVFSDAVAGQFSVDRRTMNRRLSADGKSFKNVVEDLRYSLACQLLDDTNLPLAEIAAALEFAEAASFTRAFHRWSGMAPGVWRSRKAASRLDDRADVTEERPAGSQSIAP